MGRKVGAGTGVRTRDERWDRGKGGSVRRLRRVSGMVADCGPPLCVALPTIYGCQAKLPWCRSCRSVQGSVAGDTCRAPAAWRDRDAPKAAPRTSHRLRNSLLQKRETIRVVSLPASPRHSTIWGRLGASRLPCAALRRFAALTRPLIEQRRHDHFGRYSDHGASQHCIGCSRRVPRFKRTYFRDMTDTFAKLPPKLLRRTRVVALRPINTRCTAGHPSRIQRFFTAS